MMFMDENVVSLAPRAQETNRLPFTASAAIHDLGARQRQEKAQQWLAMLVESANEAIIGQSLDGNVLSWNAAAGRLFGYATADIIGKPISILWPADKTADAQSLIKRIEGGEYVEYQEVECMRQDGQRLCVSLAISPIKSKTGAVIGASTIARDITERKRAENELHRLALHDALTGLPNRILFRERVGQAITEARRHAHQVAVLFIDLDHFKEINDSLGHQIGDRILQVTASRLRRCLREGDGVARFGGDEFVVSLSALTDNRDATLIAGKILETLREPLRIGQHELNVSGSIGIGLYPSDGQDVETLMHAADVAMYYAKNNGRGKFQSRHAAPKSVASTPSDQDKEFTSSLVEDAKRDGLTADTSNRRPSNQLGLNREFT